MARNRSTTLLDILPYWGINWMAVRLRLALSLPYNLGSLGLRRYAGPPGKLGWTLAVST